MKKGKISVILQCFNCERDIDECIESLITQTYQNIQIICVDDASTDQTRSILQRWKKTYPLIIDLILYDERQGFESSWIDPLRACKGEFITFSAADNIFYPDCFQVLTDPLLQGYDVSYGQFEEWSVDVRHMMQLSRKTVFPYNYETMTCGVNPQKLAGAPSNWRTYGTTIACLFHRRVFDMVGVSNPLYNCYFFALLSETGKLLFKHIGIKKPLIKYRTHQTENRKTPQNSSKTKLLKHHLNTDIFFQNRQWLIDHLPVLSKKQINILFPEFQSNPPAYHMNLIEVGFRCLQLSFSQKHYKKYRIFKKNKVPIRSYFQFHIDMLIENFFQTDYDNRLTVDDVAYIKGISLIVYPYIYPERKHLALNYAARFLFGLINSNPNYSFELHYIVELLNGTLLPAKIKYIKDYEKIKYLPIKSMELIHNFLLQHFPELKQALPKNQQSGE